MNCVIWTKGLEDDIQEIYERLDTWEAFPEIGKVVFRKRIRRVLVFNRNYGLYYVAEARGLILHALVDLRQDGRAIARRLSKI